MNPLADVRFVREQDQQAQQKADQIIAAGLPGEGHYVLFRDGTEIRDGHEAAAAMITLYPLVWLAEPRPARLLCTVPG